MHQILAFRHLDAYDADITTAAAPGFDNIPMIGRKTGRQHIVDLAGRAAEVLGQLIALELDLRLLLGHEGFDEALDGITESHLYSLHSDYL